MAEDVGRELSTLYGVHICFSEDALKARGDAPISLKLKDRNGIEVLGELARLTGLEVRIVQAAAVLALPDEPKESAGPVPAPDADEF